MTRKQWAETPRDLRISRRKTGRFLMQHSQHGISLLAVRIVAARRGSPGAK